VTAGAKGHRILVVTGDVLTSAMAGAAIRAWHIAHALAQDHEVVLATTSGQCSRTSDTVKLVAPPRHDFADLEAWCDVLIVQGFVLEHAPQLRASEKVMVIDMYTPLHLETMALSASGDLAARQVQNGLVLAELNRQLVRGDYFICANERQRALWIGQLSALGRINPLNWDEDPTLRRLIDTVPFGLDDVPAEHTRPALRGVVPGIGPDDDVLVWGGGVYNWFDPFTLLRAVDLLRRTRPSIRLYFLGLRHPNPEVPLMAAAAATLELADELGLSGRHVFFNDGWVDYADRQNYLLEADLAVSTHPVNAETTFSFRTRILDYLWAGAPIVTTEGDALGEIVEREGLGAVVPPGDPVALAAALERLLADPKAIQAARHNVTRVRQTFRWSVVLEPLAEFCRNPRSAPDRSVPPVPPGAVTHQPGAVLRRATKRALRGIARTALRLEGTVPSDSG
jgi:glycosyltransferase involved in cell wall biosynthesis